MRLPLIPILFALLWSTGFIVARAAAPYADLQLFLFIRFVGAALALGLMATTKGAEWPTARLALAHFCTGAVMLGAYLALSYWAIERGLPAGVMALLGALQPLFTAIILFAATGEQLPPRGWAGLGIGIIGVTLVLAPKLGPGTADSLTWQVLLAAFASILALTVGTLLQQRLARTDLFVAASIQNSGAAAVALAGAAFIGDGRWHGTLALFAALAWSILATSVLGSTLLTWMTRRGEVTKTAALMLIVPPLAAVQAYLFFGEMLTALQIFGFPVALAGVMLTRSVSRSSRRIETGTRVEPLRR